MIKRYYHKLFIEPHYIYFKLFIKNGKRYEYIY